MVYRVRGRSAIALLLSNLLSVMLLYRTLSIQQLTESPQGDLAGSPCGGYWVVLISRNELWRSLLRLAGIPLPQPSHLVTAGQQVFKLALGDDAAFL